MDSLPKNCYWKLGEGDNKEHTVITLMTLRKFRLPPKTEKLSHPTDCNIVGEAKLPLSLIFLLIVDRIKVKTCVMFQYSTKRKKCQIFSIWHFHIFSYNKIKKKSKIWHQFSIFDFKQKLNGRMTHGACSPKICKHSHCKMDQSTSAFSEIKYERKCIK